MTCSDPESARTYIQALVEVAANDAKVNTTIATVQVAGIVFLIKDSLPSIQAADNCTKVAAAGAIALLAISALLFYLYAAVITQIRMSIVRTLSNNAALHARKMWAGKGSGVHSKYGWLRWCALVALGGAVLCLGWIGYVLIFKTAPQPGT